MATEAQRMQKAMVCMNIKLHDVINDINGKTGRSIVNAIISGERDPKRLAAYRNSRIKCPGETLIKSLEGNWMGGSYFA